MKISKLFHWLYAILMFLPLLVFLPTGLYYAFNDNAQAQEYTKEEPVYYQTNEVNSIDDLITGNVYTLSYNNIFVGNEVQWVQVSEYLNIFGNISTSGTGALARTVAPYLMIQQNNLFVIKGDYSYDAYNNVMVDFVFNEEVSQTYSTILGLISSCPRFYEKEVVSNTYSMSIVDSMSNAWVHTWELPLFSWSEQTFLNQPFNYITNLFSIPNGSTFANAFGYWLSISICWLVFDVIMYVPMLVHRWIDKARLE